MTERVAFVAAIVQEGTQFYLVLGEGNHDCDRWRLTEPLVRKLAIEGFNIAMAARSPKNSNADICVRKV